MTTGIAYNRFSSDRQKDGSSIERQQEFLDGYLRSHELKIDHWMEYNDKAVSAFHGHNLDADKGLGIILGMIRSKEVGEGDHLFFQSIDRMSRLEVDIVLPIFTEILRAGVTIHFTSSHQSYTKKDIKKQQNLIMPILEMMAAHEYVQNLKSNSGIGTWKKVERYLSGDGKNLNGVGGMNLKHIESDEDGELFISEENREMLTRVIDLYLENKSWDAINKYFKANDMNGQDYFFSRTNFDRWKKSTQLYGHKTFTLIKATVDGQEKKDFDVACVPPLITKEKWQKIQNRPTKKHTRENAIVNFVTGIGITICASCGNAICAKARHDRLTPEGNYRNGDRVLVSRVGNASYPTRNDEICPITSQAMIHLFEQALVDAMQDKAIQQMIFKSSAGNEDVRELQDRQEALSASLNKENERLAGDIPDSVFDSLVKKISKIEKEKKEIDRKLSVLAGDNVSAKGRTALAKKWKKIKHDALNASNREARDEVKQLVMETFKEISIGIRVADKVHTMGLTPFVGEHLTITINQTTEEWSIYE